MGDTHKKDIHKQPRREESLLLRSLSPSATLGPEIVSFVTEGHCIPLVVAVRKLRPYFQDHLIVVLTNLQLQVILVKPDLSGRLIKWTVELG